MPASLFSRLLHKTLLIWDLFDPSALGLYRRLSRPVDGWLTRDEEAVLFRLAAAVPRDQCIVELGSWFGRSSILLGGGSRVGHGAAVVAVDQFRATGDDQTLLEGRAGDAARDYWDRFHRNLHSAGLESIVSAIRSDTADLADGWAGPPVGLLFIDADHSYEGVSRDWRAWEPRLAPNAKVAFHDYQNPAYPGVTRWVDELTVARGLMANQRCDSIMFGEVAHVSAAR